MDMAAPILLQWEAFEMHLTCRNEAFLFSHIDIVSLLFLPWSIYSIPLKGRESCTYHMVNSLWILM